MGREFLTWNKKGDASMKKSLLCLLIIITSGIIIASAFNLCIPLIQDKMYDSNIVKMDGLSEDLILKLEKEYHIAIPDNAIFIEGCRTNHPQIENYYVIVFEVQIQDKTEHKENSSDQIKHLFIDGNWYTHATSPSVNLQQWDVPITNKTYELEFEHLTETAYLQYAVQDDQTILCCFIAEI